MEKKPEYKAGNGRYQFDALDILRQARGLPTPEGHVVLTKDFVRFLEEELTRLYAVLDYAEEYKADLLSGTRVFPAYPMIDVLEALGIDASRVRAKSGALFAADKGEPV